MREIKTFDQIPDGAMLVVGLVELALIDGLDPNTDKALEAIVGASIYARASADYASNTNDRYYSAMTLNEIVAMNPLPIPKFLNMEMFDWLCVLGQIALTNEKMGFDGKVIDFNFHDRNFLNWISVIPRPLVRVTACTSTLFNDVSEKEKLNHFPDLYQVKKV